MKDMLNGDAIPFVIPQEPLNPIKKILRTPEERFEGLNLPYQPNYIHSHTHGISHDDLNFPGRQSPNIAS